MGPFWTGMAYTAFWIGVLCLLGSPFAILHYVAMRRRRASGGGTAAHGGQRVIDPDTWAAQKQAGGSAPPVARLPAPAPAPDQGGALPAPPNPQRMRSMERRHLIIIGAPGDGKTQTQIAFMVGDIMRGDHVVWASTNLALYHSRDQRTDLRPIAHLFEHTRDELEIMAVLQWASAEVGRRMPLYHEDMPHGDPVVIYVDELGGLYRRFGDILVAAMRNIGEQGRKVDVFLALAAHNALKESTGLDMALKPLFQTRLLGNVDQATWTAMVGPGIKLRGVPDGQGLWNMPDRRNAVHEVRITRPTVEQIAALAARSPRTTLRTPILEAAAPHLDRLRTSIAAAVGTSTTALARALAAEASTAPPAPAMIEPALPPATWVPSPLHCQVRELIEAAMPDLIRLMAEEGHNLAKAQELTETSNRALARRLGLGANGGTAAMKVSEIIKEWEVKGGVTLFDVPEDLSIEPVSERSERVERAERFEHPERPERLTPAA
jgi:hypothetical protein